MGFECLTLWTRLKARKPEKSKENQQTSRQPNSLIARRTTSELALARDVSTEGPLGGFLLLAFPLPLFTSKESSETSFLGFLRSFVPLSEWVIVALATRSPSLSFCHFFPVIGVITRGSLRETSGLIWLMDTILSDSGSSDFISKREIVDRKSGVSPWMTVAGSNYPFGVPVASRGLITQCGFPTKTGNGTHGQDGSAFLYNFWSSTKYSCPRVATIMF